MKFHSKISPFSHAIAIIFEFGLHEIETMEEVIDFIISVPFFLSGSYSLNN